MLIPLTLYLGRPQSADLTWQLVDSTILGQIAMNFAILTACIPSLKGVLEIFFSGASLFTVPVEYGNSYSAGGGIRSFIPSRFRYSNHWRTGDMGSHSVTISRSDNRNTMAGKRSESQVSLTDLTDNIMRTVEYEVYELPILPTTEAPSKRHIV